jgi:hypothetical protein
MKKNENDDIKALLKSAIAPVKDTELRRDLWPQMLRKLDEQPVSAGLATSTAVPWFDWALAAILSALLIFFPGTIPALLYHL